MIPVRGTVDQKSQGGLLRGVWDDSGRTDKRNVVRDHFREREHGCKRDNWVSREPLVVMSV